MSVRKSTLSVLVAGAVAFSSAFGVSQQSPRIVGKPLSAPATTIEAEGTADLPTFICVDKNASKPPEACNTNGKARAVVNGAPNGEFSADAKGLINKNLKVALVGGDVVWITQVPAKGAPTVSDPVTVLAAPVAPPEISGTIAANQTTIVGKSAKNASITVHVAALKPIGKLPCDATDDPPQAAAVAGSTGHFKAMLTSGVEAKDWVWVCSLVRGETTPVASDAVQVSDTPTPTPPTIQGKVISTSSDTVVAGAATPGDDVSIHSSAKAIVGEADCKGSALMAPAKADGKGHFSFTVKPAVPSGDFVWACQGSDPATEIASAPMAVSAAAVTPPAIKEPLGQNDTSISGTATANYMVHFNKSASSVESQPGCENTDPTVKPVSAKDGAFKFSKLPALQGGDSVWVCQVAAGASLATAIPSKVITVPIALDSNEREHTDFVGGALFSANGNNYSQGDVFLAFNYDRTIRVPGNFFPDSKGHGPGWNSFFQARLTSIPVNMSSLVSTTTTKAGMTTATQPTPTVSSFLASQKTGVFEGGVYFPFTFAKTPHGATKFTQTFYIAPLGRFGFSTPSNPSTNATVSTSSSAAGTVTTTTTPTSLGSTTAGNEKLYNFWLAGARIGTADIDPGSLHTRHYFDIGVGKYSNLQSLYCPVSAANNCNATTTAANGTVSVNQPPTIDPTKENRVTVYRLVFQGYLELPLTTTQTFILGMSANTSPGIFPRKTGFDNANHAADDLSFLFGYKFDASKLFAGFKFIGN